MHAFNADQISKLTKLQNYFNHLEFVVLVVGMIGNSFMPLSLSSLTGRIKLEMSSSGTLLSPFLRDSIPLLV